MIDDQYKSNQIIKCTNDATLNQTNVFIGLSQNIFVEHIIY